MKHFRRVQVVALVAVLGPGLLAGLSDDDPAGITTYSLIGTEYGYQLLWVLAASTVALILFHDVTALAANLGTTAAEFAGIAASLDIAGVTKYVSIPVAAILVSTLVLRGSFRRVQQVLLVMGSLLGSYVISGFLAGPDWSQALHGLVTPSVPLDRTAILLTTATIGTTLAPWGIAFLQSYVVDKRLGVDDLRFERIDVIVGSVLTGVIGFFVVVACAATLHEEGKTISSASDAAAALEPLAGHLASTLFAVGLLGAGLLAAAILPLSTAYSVSEAVGVPAALDRRLREAPVFYGVYGFVIVVDL